MQWAIISDFVLKIIKSKWFWLSVFIVILFLVIRHNWDKITLTLGLVKPTANLDPANIAQMQELSTERKNQLASFSELLYRSFQDNNWTNSLLSDSRIDACNNLLACSDVELMYIAEYYKGVNKTSIYSDLQSETSLLIFGSFFDAANKLLVRLKQLQEI